MIRTFAVSRGKNADKQGDNKSKLETFLQNINWPRAILVLLITAFLISVFVKASGQPDAFAWLLGGNGATGGPLPGDIGIALGPILALALAIERLIETIFDMFETNIAQVAKYTSAGEKGLKYIDDITTLYTDEMFKAKNALMEAMNSSETSPAKKSELLSALEAAEQRLKDTGVFWENLPKDPQYVSWKRAITIWLGLVAGMVVAVFNDQGLFYYLNQPVPRLLDMLVTGFVLGAGSGPIHSLVGILQSAKDSLSNVGSLAGFGAVQNELRSLRSEIEKK